MTEMTRETVESTAIAPLRMLRWCRITYPKLVLLATSIIAAYYVFTLPAISSFLNSFGAFGYIGIFIAGLLFSFGFTTPFAIGLFATLNPANIFIASIIGGIGALVSDLCIYMFIKFSFMDEFTRLQKTRPFQMIIKTFTNNLAAKIRIYLLYMAAGIILASPLPDEIGISMLAGITTVKTKNLALLSFIMNTLGVFIVLFISR